MKRLARALVTLAAVCLVAACIWLWADMRERAARHHGQLRLQRELDRLAGDRDPVSGIESRLRGLRQRYLPALFDAPARPRPQVVNGLQPRISAFCRRMRGLVSLTVLDEAGAPIAALSNDQLSRHVLQKLWGAMTAWARHDRSGWQRHRPMLRALLGERYDPSSEAFDRLRPAALAKDRSYVYLTEPAAGGMLLAYLHHHPTLAQVWAEALLPTRLPSGIRLAVIDREQLASGSAALGVTTDRLAGVLRGLLAGHTETMTPQGILLAIPWTTTLLIAGHFDPAGTPALAHIHRDRAALWILLLVIGVPALVLAARPPAAHRDWSLRTQIALLLAATAALPLLAAWSLAWQHLDELNRLSTARWQMSQRLLLNDFDSRFPRYVERLTSSLQTGLTSNMVASQPDFAALADQVLSTSDPLGAVKVHLYSEDGQDHIPAARTRRGLAAAGRTVAPYDYRSLAKSLLSLINEHNRPSRHRGVVASGRGVNAVLERIEWIAWRNLGKVMEFDYQSGIFWLKQLAIFDRDRNARAIVFCLWPRLDLERNYVSDQYQVLQRELPDTRLRSLAFTGGSDDVPRLPRSPRLTRLVGTLRTEGRFNGLARTRQGSPIVLSGLRGRHLASYALLALTDASPIQREIRNASALIVGLAIMLLGFSTMIGAILRRRLLTPIGLLGEGVAALRRRDFTWRAPDTRTSDEIGHLLSTFNQMMSDAGDLQIARMVQERLFPVAPLDIGAGTLFGRCSQAAQVGGDYFDYGLLPDGRARLIVGDVSGHGVSAALIVGMAKALASHPDTPCAPSAALTLINLVFRRRLKRRKMMTMWWGVYDPGTHALTWSNAGNPPPCLVHGGEPSYLSLPGLPLGTGGKIPYRELTVTLAPGDCVVWFSDGIPEASDASGNQIGYDVLLEQAPGLVGRTATDTVANWHAWIAAKCGEKRQDDDITVCALQLDGPT